MLRVWCVCVCVWGVCVCVVCVWCVCVVCVWCVVCVVCVVCVCVCVPYLFCYNRAFLYGESSVRHHHNK